MYIHQKTVVDLSLITFIIIGLLFLVCCSNQDQISVVFTEDTNSVHKDAFTLDEDEFLFNQEHVFDSEMWFYAGVRIKELSSIPGIDNHAILVN